MNNKRFILIAIALLFLFGLPQNVVSGKPKNPVKIARAFSSRTYSVGITEKVGFRRLPIFSPDVFEGPIVPVKKKYNCRDKELYFHLDPNVLTSVPVYKGLYLNPRLTRRTILGTLASSIKTNPSLRGNWRINQWVSNDPQLQSELIDIFHTSIRNNEYINISNDNIVSYFSCGHAILSTDVQSDFINSLDNETPEITWITEDVIALHLGDRNEVLFLHRVTKETPSHIGRTIGNSSSPHTITLPQRDVKADISVKIDADCEETDIELSTISTPNDDTNWWDKYIKNLIEDQMIHQGIEKIEKQIENRDNQPNDFDKLYQFIPIRHDIKQESNRNTSYIIYINDYELAA